MTFFLNAFLNAFADEIRPVGTFGGFIKDGKADIPQNNGFLTFSTDNNLAAHGLKWKKFAAGGNDFTVAEIRFPDIEPRGKLHFLDWSTLKVASRLVSAYLSRSIPAVQYDSGTASFKIATALDGRSPMNHFAVVLNGRITNFDLSQLHTIDLRAMSEPWILLWAGKQKGWHFDVPLLITFEKKPQFATGDIDGIKFSFASRVGVVNVMPLKGLERFEVAVTEAWDDVLPDNIIIESRSWVEKLAAFPVGMKETFILSADKKSVQITDKYLYKEIKDDWGTTPTPIAPLPPVVVRAGSKNYPVQYPEQVPVITSVATFYGPFSFVPGSSSSYTIPLPNALKRLPIPLRMINSPTTAPIREQLEKILTDKMPSGPSNYYVHNDDIAAALMCDVFPTLTPNGSLQNKIQTLVPLLLSGSFADDRVPFSTEPVTNQQYRSPGKHKFEAEPFDREWYTGRKLAAMTRCSEYLDLQLAKQYWSKIRELYRYNQIFFDWVTGSVTSSVYGYNELADGMHFAWEGMLGVARMAKLLGDHTTYEDAAYRSARQQLALFATWYQAEWNQKIDYGIAHFSVQKLPADQIETRGAIDAWVEDFGSATLEFKSHWQTANFLFFDNSAQYSF
ncbi:MAG: hypothetical protein AABY86_09395, partial [Bdellovibrionota bacterium]